MNIPVSVFVLLLLIIGPFAVGANLSLFAYRRIAKAHDLAQMKFAQWRKRYSERCKLLVEHQEQLEEQLHATFVSAQALGNFMERRFPELVQQYRQANGNSAGKTARAILDHMGNQAEALQKRINDLEAVSQVDHQVLVNKIQQVNMLEAAVRDYLDAKKACESKKASLRKFRERDERLQTLEDMVTPVNMAITQQAPLSINPSALGKCCDQEAQA